MVLYLCMEPNLLRFMAFVPQSVWLMRAKENSMTHAPPVAKATVITLT